MTHILTLLETSLPFLAILVMGIKGRPSPCTPPRASHDPL